MKSGPLAGVRVVDFTWAAMGPFAGYLLAGLGAEVIQISRPVKGASSTTAAITQFFDAGKICIKVDVKSATGKQLLLDLITKSDVLLENFRPGVIEGLGFSYTSISEANSDLVMISGSALGRGGPESAYVGYAPIFSALSGLADATGFPNGPPTEIRYPCDLTGGALMAFAAIAGLIAARRSCGVYVDLAARDALLWTLTSSIALVGPPPLPRIGNGHGNIFPHGVFKCAGDDRWVAIAARDDGQRRALFSLIGGPAITRAAVQNLSDADRERIEASITAWTSDLSATEAVERLQQIGIAAFASVDARDLWDDRHVRARNVFQYNDNVGWIAGPPWSVDGARSVIAAAKNGREALAYVCGGILGMDDAAIDELVSQGIVE